jgi:hypothetical protein
VIVVVAIRSFIGGERLRGFLRFEFVALSIIFLAAALSSARPRKQTGDRAAIDALLSAGLPSVLAVCSGAAGDVFTLAQVEDFAEQLVGNKTSEQLLLLYEELRGFWEVAVVGIAQPCNERDLKLCLQAVAILLRATDQAITANGGITPQEGIPLAPVNFAAELFGGSGVACLLPVLHWAPRVLPAHSPELPDGTATKKALRSAEKARDTATRAYDAWSSAYRAVASEEEEKKKQQFLQRENKLWKRTLEERAKSERVAGALMRAVAVALDRLGCAEAKAVAGVGDRLVAIGMAAKEWIDKNREDFG